MRPEADVADEQSTAPNLLALKRRGQFLAVTLIKVNAGFDRTCTRRTDEGFHRREFALQRDLIILFPSTQRPSAREDTCLIKWSVSLAP